MFFDLAMLAALKKGKGDNIERVKSKIEYLCLDHIYIIRKFLSTLYDGGKEEFKSIR